MRKRCKLCRIMELYLSDSERDLINGYLYGDYSDYFIASFLEKTLKIGQIDHMTVQRHRVECMGLTHIPKPEEKESLKDYIIVERRGSRSNAWDSCRERNDKALEDALS